MTDPIADMLTRIRNANQMRSKEVSMPTSKMKVEIAYRTSDYGNKRRRTDKRDT